MLTWLTRWWNDAPLRVKGTAVIGILLIPLVVSALLALVASRTAGTANDWMSRANRTQSQIAAVLRLVVDAGDGVAVFLVTHDRQDLRPFESADAALPLAIADLELLVWDSAGQLDHVRRIAALAATHPLGAILDSAQQSPAKSVPAPVLAEGRAAVQALRRELASMRERQDRLIAGRQTLTRRFLVSLAVGGAVFGLLFGVLGMMAFVAGVVRRIDRLRTDAERLAHGEPLDPPFDAADELGALTGSINEASRLLRAHFVDDRQLGRALPEFIVVAGERAGVLARLVVASYFSLPLAGASR
jgi:CHASE3 domain sensor protein